MVTTQEVTSVGGEVASDASDELNSYDGGELNQGIDEAGAFGDEASDEAASSDEELDSEAEYEIDPAIRGRIEQEMRSKIDPELRKFNSRMQSTLARERKTMNEERKTLLNHLIEQLEEQGLDPSVLKLDILDAKQIKVRDQVRQQFARGEQQWKAEEPEVLAKIAKFEEEKAYNPATRQWAVDTSDPELVKMKDAMVEVSRQFVLTGGQDPDLFNHGKALGEQYRSVFMKKAEEGAKRSGTPKSQSRQAQPPQQKQAMQNAKQRGKVIAGRPGGGSSPVTFGDYIAQAKAEKPKASPMEQYIRAEELKQIALAESRRK